MPAAASPTTIHDLLAEYASRARNPREKGDLLEKLVRSYLTTDPVYTAIFDDVWLWQDWPGRAGKPDTGIDLVAKERYGDGYCAIQCKFFAASHTLQKSDIDSFFTASGKTPFTSRMIVSTTEKWSTHALDALDDQLVKTTRIGVRDMADSGVDWSSYSLAAATGLRRSEPKALRDHQTAAMTDVVSGFEESDRGKLIMACGTGKTFTGLRVAEAIAGRGGSVLLLVPSIALLSQTLTEWAADCSMPLRPFAICSDSKVGRSAEDYSVSDLPFPASTDTAALLRDVASGSLPDGLTVYFSTYQSIDVIAKAQQAGLADFDLIVCDEAHRTAGFTRADSRESVFQRVHDENSIRAARRLYMTATPKVYGEAARSKAADDSAVIFSMDDETVFGPVFHRLGFGEAVERELLTDYRVLVLAVDEESVGSGFQSAFASASADGDLNIPDAARVVGIYNGLAKRGVEGLGPATSDRAPLRRAVAFSRSIRDSKTVRDQLDGYDDGFLRPHGVMMEPTADDLAADPSGIGPRRLRLEARHVDGTMNVMVRNGLLEWLKEETDAEDDVCRILTNARCLSEGVDVPALDAVIFLNSRDSQVDVVQSVGRVMRRAPGKDYGYIILPIAVPSDKTPEQALNDNVKYKVVWDVLRALRAHDERFEAKIESIDLNGRGDDQLQVIAVSGDGWEGAEPDGSGRPGSTAVPMDWSALGTDWRTAIYAKIVEKVGERDYWDTWATSVADIAKRQETRISSLVTGSDASLRKEFEAFTEGLRNNLNPSISEADAIEMLSQHLITQPVFDALFDDYAFSAHNPVSQVMQVMVEELERSNVGSETNELTGFYTKVQDSVRSITDAGGKQTTIKRLYEKFFATAFGATSKRLGIVYTPNEIVDFILRSTDEVLFTEFGHRLTDDGVHILDPFTGTGTFIVRLLQSGLIEPDDLERKFRHELHANEIVLLAYYIAAVNIESTYHLVRGSTSYESFPGIVLTDTFQSSESHDGYDDHGLFDDNDDRVRRQSDLDIAVIIGNPPYSAGQSSANDNNQNVKYPHLDRRIADTYAARSSAVLKNSLYDSYIRAIRWASDRIGRRGVISFVTNNGYLDANTAAGVRLVLEEEFASLHVLDLTGNSRMGGDAARRQGGNVFEVRVGVAICILVKNGDRSSSGIRYLRAADYTTRAEKLRMLDSHTVHNDPAWQTLTPNDSGDWLGMRNPIFGRFLPIGSKAGGEQSVFTVHTGGVKTNRDPWVTNSSLEALRSNVGSTIDFYNDQVARFVESGRGPDEVDDVIDYDARRFSWDRADKKRLLKGVRYAVDPDAFRIEHYRPFNKQNLYFSRTMNNTVSRIPRVHPDALTPNVGIYIVGIGSAVPFSVLITNEMPDLHLTGAGSNGQYFPRAVFEERAVDAADTLFSPAHEAGHGDDNIAASVVDVYRARYGGVHSATIDSDAVFHFVYGILHSPDYRATYATDLTKMLPRVPLLAEPADFWAFTEAGRELAALHLGYETVTPYPLAETRMPGAGTAVTKMTFAGRPGAWDGSTVVYNEGITLTGIPDAAHEYMIGSRSAIEWVLERYQVKTDKASGIVNDPNDWAREHDDPTYILDLLKRIVTVSVETVRIVNALPPLRISEEYGVNDADASTL